MPLRSSSPLLRFATALLLIAQLFTGVSPRPALALNRSETGRWTPTQSHAGTQVHMVLMPSYDGTYHSKVLWWYGIGHHETFYGDLLGWTPGDYDCSTYPSSHLVDLDFAFPPDTAQVFCAGNTLLGDGNLFLAGGTQSGTENGMCHAFLYKPESNTWSRLDSMNYYRWYPTATTMADGNVLVTSGTSYLHIHQMYGRRNSESNPRDSRLFRLGLIYNGSRDSPVSVFTFQGADTAPPSPREGAAGTYSFGTTATILYGGKDSAGLRQDAHLLRLLKNPNGVEYDYNWEGLAPEDVPPAGRYEHTIIACRDSTPMFVYGGITRNAGGTEVANSEVWRLRRDVHFPYSWRWSQPVILGSPPGARCGHTAYFDEPRRRMLVFGGRSTPTGTPTDRDIWALTFSVTQDTATWSKLTVSGDKPEARFDHAWAFDQAGPDSNIVMFGGEQAGGALLSNLWKLKITPFDGSLSWEEITAMDSLSPPPSPRSQHAMTYEPGSHRISVFGGKLVGGALDDTLHIGVFHAHATGQRKGWVNNARGDYALRNQVAILERQALYERRPEIHGPDSTTNWSAVTSSSAPHLQEWYPRCFRSAPTACLLPAPTPSPMC